MLKGVSATRREGSTRRNGISKQKGDTSNDTKHDTIATVLLLPDHLDPDGGSGWWTHLEDQMSTSNSLLSLPLPSCCTECPHDVALCAACPVLGSDLARMFVAGRAETNRTEL